MPSLKESRAWKALDLHRRDVEQTHMRDLYAQEPDRFDRYSIQWEDMLVDYSKNRIVARDVRLSFSPSRASAVSSSGVTECLRGRRSM